MRALQEQIQRNAASARQGTYRRNHMTSLRRRAVDFGIFARFPTNAQKSFSRHGYSFKAGRRAVIDDYLREKELGIDRNEMPESLQSYPHRSPTSP